MIIRRRVARSLTIAALTIVFGIALSVGNLSTAVGAASSLDWSAYEHGPYHHSVSYGDTAITPTTVATLHAAWRFVAAKPTQSGQPGAGFDASPVVVGGRVYIGAKTGLFSVLNATTGAVIWQRQLDYGSNTYCPAKGITGTASVLPDPVTGALTVYAPGAQYLYALNAATGAVQWKTAIGPATADGEAHWYNWSSPTIDGGRIYMGLAANCNTQKIRGGEVQVDQHTGAVLHTWYAVPAGTIGPSVWSSPAADGTSVWVTTGNPDPSAAAVYDAFSVVRLDAKTFTKQDKWTASFPVSADLDFGSSPTYFDATIGGVDTNLIGACNKNGTYYVWRSTALSAGPVWQRVVGQNGGNGGGSCIASAAFDGTAGVLFVAGNQTTINGVASMGSVRALDPATGAILWQQPLACLPNGSPTLNGTTHVLAVPLYGCSGSQAGGVALFNAQTGAALRVINTTGKIFAQPVFASGYLFVADEIGVLSAFKP